MSVKPILFNTDMVRAILDGRKTATRRGIKYPHCGYFENEPPRVMHPYQLGDIIYVRETWCKNPNYEEYYFRTRRSGIAPYGLKWRPSIHMPKEAARIWLKVTDVRVERLQDITEEQAKAEGANYKDGRNVGMEEKMCRTAIERFAEIWDSTVNKSYFKQYGWKANPWVWVIEFERCDKPKEGE